MGTGCNPPLPIEIDYHLQKLDYEIAQFHDVILYTLWDEHISRDIL